MNKVANETLGIPEDTIITFPKCFECGNRNGIIVKPVNVCYEIKLDDKHMDVKIKYPLHKQPSYKEAVQQCDEAKFTCPMCKTCNIVNMKMISRRTVSIYLDAVTDSKGNLLEDMK